MSNPMVVRFPYRWTVLFVCLALTLALAGCGSDKVTAPANGAVFFRVDAQSCGGTGTITFYIDGAAVGIETLSAGGTSKSYTTPAGQHVVGATEVQGYIWLNKTITVPSGGTYTHVLLCV